MYMTGRHVRELKKPSWPVDKNSDSKLAKKQKLQSKVLCHTGQPSFALCDPCPMSEYAEMSDHLKSDNCLTQQKILTQMWQLMSPRLNRMWQSLS